MLVYNANGRAISAGDTFPARYMPFALWHYRTLSIDPIETLTAQGRGETAHWIRRLPDGRNISLYPVVLPVLLTPLYLPAVIYLDQKGWTDQRLDHIARIMEKICASLMAALSSMLLYITMRRRASEGNSLLLTAAYALGTTTWVISSQALWQHGIGQLLVVATLLLLTGHCTTTRTIFAGLLCGLIAGNRPADAILAVALGTYGLFWARRRGLLLIAAALLPSGLVLLYNLTMAGHFAGAYGLSVKRRATFFTHDLCGGIAGLLLSPVRGLFVFSPFLLFLALCWKHRPINRNERFLSLAIIAGVGLQIALYAKSDWRAGLSFGTRFLTDLLPLLIWLLVPVVVALRKLARATFVLAVGAAIAIQAVGEFFKLAKATCRFTPSAGPARCALRGTGGSRPF